MTLDAAGVLLRVTLTDLVRVLVTLTVLVRVAVRDSDRDVVIEIDRDDEGGRKHEAGMRLGLENSFKHSLGSTVLRLSSKIISQPSSSLLNSPDSINPQDLVAMFSSSSSVK
jgi:hypothetical protein